MRVYQVQGQAKPVKFTGTLLATESTETDKSMRWLELELFRIDDGQRTGQYVLHRIGQSVVFHRPQTCGYGVSTTADKVPFDAEPCPVCNPVYDCTPDPLYEVWLESPRHKVVTCPTPQQVEKALLMRRKDGSTFLSTPATNLIAKASANDAKLQAYFQEAEEL